MFIHWLGVCLFMDVSLNIGSAVLNSGCSHPQGVREGTS